MLVRDVHNLIAFAQTPLSALVNYSTVNFQKVACEYRGIVIKMSDLDDLRLGLAVKRATTKPHRSLSSVDYFGRSRALAADALVNLLAQRKVLCDEALALPSRSKLQFEELPSQLQVSRFIFV